MGNILDIKGFKCFVSQEIPMRPLTVLAGSNSVGKSSVIQSLLLLRLAHEKASAGISKIPLNGEYALGLGNSFNVISRQQPSSTISILFSYKGIHERAELFADIKEAQVFLKIEKPDVPRVWHDAIPNHPVLKPDFHYLNAERLGPRPFYSVADSGRSVGSQGENTISLLSSSAAETPEYDVAKEKRFPDTENPRLRRQVEWWVNHIIPGISIDLRKVLETNVSYIQYDGASPHNVGFGISYVLPIIVAGLIARNGEMLIVENPEAHLHPSGQSRIGRFLAQIASSGVQVIIETHSEHVINGIRIASLDGTINHDQIIINFFSKHEKKEVTIKSIDINSTGNLTNYPRGFFDQQQVDFAEIVKHKRGK